MRASSCRWRCVRGLMCPWVYLHGRQGISILGSHVDKTVGCWNSICYQLCMCTVADVCGSERLQHVREKTVMKTVCAFFKNKGNEGNKISEHITLNNRIKMDIRSHIRCQCSKKKSDRECTLWCKCSLVLSIDRTIYRQEGNHCSGLSQQCTSYLKCEIKIRIIAGLVIWGRNSRGLYAVFSLHCCQVVQ